MCEKCIEPEDVEPTQDNCISSIIFLEERLDEFTTDKRVAIETLINEYCAQNVVCRPSAYDPIGMCSCLVCEFGSSS
jgi:hypothetical protein